MTDKSRRARDTERRLVLNEHRTPDSISTTVGSIKENGDLVIEGYDAGTLVEEIWGDSDYEYWITVESQDKDLLLMKLLAERFATDSAIRTWLEKNGVPCRFSNWI